MSEPPPVQMMQLLYGAVLANLVSAVAEYGIADLLTDGPRQVDELAEQTGTDPDALHRTLRALATASVFTETAPRCFGLTPLAETLRSGVAGSMRDHARNWGSPEYQRGFAELGYSLRTGFRPRVRHRLVVPPVGDSAAGRGVQPGDGQPCATGCSTSCVPSAGPWSQRAR